PVKTPSLFQSGSVTSDSLYVFNSGISNDRACTLICKHGNSMVISLTTSSSSTFPAMQTVSKVGTGAQSGLVMVHASTTFDQDFTCSPVCRWGDYGGATPDPAKTGGSEGQVWITNEYTTGSISPDT